MRGSARSLAIDKAFLGPSLFGLPWRDWPRSVRVDMVFVPCKLVPIPVDIMLPIACSHRYSVRLRMVLLSMTFRSGMPWRTCDMQRAGIQHFPEETH